MLQRAIVLDDLAAKPCQRRAAAPASTELGFNKRLTKEPVELSHEQPCPPIGHAHGAAGGSYGAVRSNSFQEHDLPRTEPSVA
jgi:hypothetical protein